MCKYSADLAFTSDKPTSTNFTVTVEKNCDEAYFCVTSRCLDLREICFYVDLLLFCFVCFFVCFFWGEVACLFVVVFDQVAPFLRYIVSQYVT